jgi:hypothetical protein
MDAKRNPATGDGGVSGVLCQALKADAARDTQPSNSGQAREHCDAVQGRDIGRSGGSRLPYVPIAKQSFRPPAKVQRAGTSHRETDHSYPCLARISDTIRIIQCRDAIQWIIQKRTGGRWRSISFHRDRDVLIERCASFNNDAIAVLRSLPAFHLGREGCTP